MIPSKATRLQALKALAAEGSGATDEERDTALRIIRKLEEREAEKSAPRAGRRGIDGWSLGIDPSSEKDLTEWCVVYIGHCPRCRKMIPIRLTEKDIWNEAPVGGGEARWTEYLGAHAGKICKCGGKLS